jgi:hypothetical protein
MSLHDTKLFLHSPSGEANVPSFAMLSSSFFRRWFM